MKRWAAIPVALLALIGLALLLWPDPGEERAAAVRQELFGTAPPKRAPRVAAPAREPVFASDTDTEAGAADAPRKVLDPEQVARGKQETELPEPLERRLGGMDRMVPRPERLDELEARRGKPLDDEDRASLDAEFRARFDEAAEAAGRYRLGELDLDAATASMDAAHAGYRAYVIELSGISATDYEAVFGLPER